MKYRLEYARPRPGGPVWDPYDDFDTRQAAQRAAAALPRQFGRATRTRIVPIAGGAPATESGDQAAPPAATP